MGKVRQWTTRHLAFAERAQLINSMVFGLYSYWASIFIILQDVIDRINTICRNFLWGGQAKYKRSPLIA